MININILQKSLKIKFKDKSLLIKALTHKSANQEINNEKLEFLGDRVIGLVLSKKLFDLYPNENEGVLDKRLAKLVNKKTCSNVAWSIEMQNYIIISDNNKKITQKDEKILSDACEALIGAIFIDKGFDFVTKFIVKNWKTFLNKSFIVTIDSKTKLQEYSLKKYKILPIYKILEQKGPKHDPIFKVSVKIKNSKLFIGNGKSIKEAQQNAANLLIGDLI